MSIFGTIGPYNFYKLDGTLGIPQKMFEDRSVPYEDGTTWVEAGVKTEITRLVSYYDPSSSAERLAKLAGYHDLVGEVVSVTIHNGHNWPNTFIVHVREMENTRAVITASGGVQAGLFELIMEWTVIYGLDVQ